MEDTGEIRKKEIAIYYSNIAGIEGSIYDFKLLFGRKKNIKAEANNDDWEAGVYMSPQHAKAFAKLLDLNIKNYEKKFGEINMKEFEYQAEYEQNNASIANNEVASF